MLMASAVDVSTPQYAIHVTFMMATTRDRHGKLLGDSQFVQRDSAVFLESVTILLFPYDACVVYSHIKNAKLSPLHKLLQQLRNKADIPCVVV
jgi:hypothetical protein